MEAEGADAIALSSPLLRAVESMAYMLWMWVALSPRFFEVRDLFGDT
jgi:hypothetical protein